MNSRTMSLHGGTEPSSDRRLAALQLLGLLVLTAVLLPAMSPRMVVAHGAVTKTLFLARMLVLVGLAAWLLHAGRRTWSDTGLRRPRLWKTLLAIPLGAVASGVGVAAVKVALDHAGVRSADYSMFAPLKGDLGEYLFWAVAVTWGSAALGEELLFRGFVLNSIETALGGPGRLATGGAILLQAVIFGALHLYQGMGGAAVAGTIGLVLGLVWLSTGRNLWAGIVIHGLFDFASMTAIYMGAMPHP